MTALQAFLADLVRHTGLPQQQIAGEVGISEKHLSQMLNGRVEGTLSTWQAVLDAAGVSLGELNGERPMIRRRPARSPDCGRLPTGQPTQPEENGT
jgi:transcriptional regulator with XRE-family HTH domain